MFELKDLGRHEEEEEEEVGVGWGLVDCGLLACVIDPVALLTYPGLLKGGGSGQNVFALLCKYPCLAEEAWRLRLCSVGACVFMLLCMCCCMYVCACVQGRHTVCCVH